MASTDGAGDGRDGRRRGVLDKRLDKLRSESRGVVTTGGARARRGRGVLVSADGYARPPTMQTTTGGAESSPVMDMLAGLSVVAGAWRNRRPVNVRIGVYSDRSGRCRDGMVRQARESVGAGVLFQCYGSGGYSDRSGRCRDAMGCSGQRDGALWLSEVGSQHARGDRSATADGIGHSVGQLMGASV